VIAGGSPQHPAALRQLGQQRGARRPELHARGLVGSGEGFQPPSAYQTRDRCIPHSLHRATAITVHRRALLRDAANPAYC
jgi:hypothetical protein